MSPLVILPLLHAIAPDDASMAMMVLYVGMAFAANAAWRRVETAKGKKGLVIAALVASLFVSLVFALMLGDSSAVGELYVLTLPAFAASAWGAHAGLARPAEAPLWGWLRSTGGFFLGLFVGTLGTSVLSR